MKNCFELILLCCCLPIFALGQKAFKQARVLSLEAYEELIYAENLDQILEVYHAAGALSDSDRTQVETIVAFAKNPFGVELNYTTFSVKAIVRLNNEVRANIYRKSEILDYNCLKPCSEAFPEDRNLFYADHSIFVSQADLRCYEANFLEKYPDREPFPPGQYTTETEREAPNITPVPTPLSVPTKIIDGTSKFLVARVKEELLLAFFDDFLKEIRESKELTSLLPNSYFLLENSDIFKAPSMGAAWVTAFEEDLAQFPQNLEQLLIASPEYAELIETPSIQVFLLANSIFQTIESGGNLDVWQLANEYYEEFADSDFYLIQILGLADLIQENLRAIDGNWYTEADVNELLSLSENAALYFAGLLYQQNRDLFQKITVTLGDQQVPLLEILRGDAAEFVRGINALIRTGNKLNYDFLVLVNPQFDRTEKPDLYRETLVKLAYDFFEFLDETVSLINFKDRTAFFNSDYTRFYKPLAFETLATLDAALAKDYGALLVHSTQVLQPIIEARITALDRKLVGVADEEQKQIRKQIQQLNNFVKTYLYYGGFMVDVLSAETSDEVQFIIDKYAAPVQSYRVNRQSDFTMNFGAYPGLYAGYESSESILEESFVTGVTAPLGLSLSLGKQKMGFRKPSSSIALFFPIIDIGAPFSYRWENDATGFPANLTWRQVLSPGAHLVWGLGNTPLALTLGAQYTPELRRVTESGLEFQANAWRVGASLTVDIPIFYLKR